MDKFSGLDTEVIGISFDSLEEHQRFAREHDITFPLVADEKGTIRAAGYGGGRITFLVDKGGIVRHVQKGVPNNDEFLEAIRVLGD